MHILIDILHPAHLMFYKRTISELKHRHKLTVLLRPRGDLIEFARRELDVPIRVAGRHFRTRLGKILGAIHRVIYLLVEGYRNPYDVITSHGGCYAAIAAKLSGRRSVIFYDTYEYRLEFCLCQWFASTFVIPSSLKVHGKNIKTFNGYKELAYLYNFVPSESILEEYKVEKKKYVLIRHIAHISLDCWRHTHEAILQRAVKYLHERNYTIVASIEQNADTIPLLSSSARVIRKPTSEMHSLIYHSCCTISSGGTVAQEAALLGTPAIYIGDLQLRVQRELIRTGLLKCLSRGDIIPTLLDCLQKQHLPFPYKKYGWEDTTKVIIRHLEG